MTFAQQLIKAQTLPAIQQFIFTFLSIFSHLFSRTCSVWLYFYSLPRGCISTKMWLQINSSGWCVLIICRVTTAYFGFRMSWKKRQNRFSKINRGIFSSFSEQILRCLKNFCFTLFGIIQKAITQAENVPLFLCLTRGYFTTKWFFYFVFIKHFWMHSNCICSNNVIQIKIISDCIFLFIGRHSI